MIIMILTIITIIIILMIIITRVEAQRPCECLRVFRCACLCLYAQSPY